MNQFTVIINVLCIHSLFSLMPMADIILQQEVLSLLRRGTPDALYCWLQIKLRTCRRSTEMHSLKSEWRLHQYPNTMLLILNQDDTSQWL